MYVALDVLFFRLKRKDAVSSTDGQGERGRGDFGGGGSRVSTCSKLGAGGDTGETGWQTLKLLYTCAFPMSTLVYVGRYVEQ